MDAAQAASSDGELLKFMTTIGWYPERRVDIGPDLEAWSSSDYRAAGVILQFMAECGNLAFDYPRHRAVGGMHSCIVSGALSVKRIPRSLVAVHEDRLGRGLCPIGQSGSGNLFLLMDAEGVTYGCHDRFLARIAGDGYHALQAIHRRDRFVPVT